MEVDTDVTRRTLLEKGPAPAIRGTLVDDREPDPGTLKKKTSNSRRERDSARRQRSGPPGGRREQNGPHTEKNRTREER